jgi:hypothetical protein
MGMVRTPEWDYECDQEITVCNGPTGRDCAKRSALEMHLEMHGKKQLIT